MNIIPENLSPEQNLLKSMLLNSDALTQCMEIVETSDFSQIAHRNIFDAIINLFYEDKPCNPATLQEELNRQGLGEIVGGDKYLSLLFKPVSNLASAEFYAKLVKEKSLLRKLIKLAGELSKHANDFQIPVESIIDTNEQELCQYNPSQTNKPYIKVNEQICGALAYLEQLFEGKQMTTGISTGFTDLDEYTAGFRNSDFIILAARPSMGATAFALNLAHNVACHQQIPVMIFSLDLDNNQMLVRLICSESRIDEQKIRRGYVTQEDWAEISIAASMLEDSSILIDDSANATLLEIINKSRQAHVQENIGMIIIDYLQLITLSSASKSANQQQKVSIIARSLKSLACELNIPIVCLSQLLQSAESRPDKRPMLLDLIEANTIEQSADTIMLLYREHHYNPEKEECRGQAEIIIAKHNNGPTGVVKLAFNSAYTKFDNLAREKLYEESIF